MILTHGIPIRSIFTSSPTMNRETARQCSSMLAHISHQRLFRASLTRRLKIESHWDRDPFARATTCLPSWRVPGNLLAEMGKSLHTTSRSSEAKSHVSSELRTYRFGIVVAEFRTSRNAWIYG